LERINEYWDQIEYKNRLCGMILASHVNFF